MPQIDSFPYRIFESSLVQTEEWQLGESGYERTMPESLKDWDPLTDLHFSRTLTVDFPEIFSQCGLSSGAVIMLTVSWYSPGTTLRERIASYGFPYGSGRCPVNFACRVPGTKLSGSVELVTRVVLGRSGVKDDSLAASQTGAILWQDEHAMRVEGFGARFPMEFADFSELGYPPNAGWRLYWKRDFQAQLMGSVCLLINRQHERLRGIASGAVGDPQAPAILEAIEIAVARELIVGGLTNDEFIEETVDFPKGSIGEAIRHLIRKVFGNQAPEAVRQTFCNEPDRFDCQLQAALKLFHPRPPSN